MLLIWTLLKHLIKTSREILLAKQVQIGCSRRIPMPTENWLQDRRAKVTGLTNKWQRTSLLEGASQNAPGLAVRTEFIKNLYQ